MNRPLRALLSAAAAMAVLWPLHRDVLDDGFPLSTYPMFIHDRSTARLYRAVGLRGDREVILPPRIVTGDDQEPMLAALALERGIKRNKKGRKKLCRELADAAQRDSEFADLDAVELRVELHDPIAYFIAARAPAPLETKRRTRCALEAPP